MEGIQLIDLLDKNYEKVFSLMARELKNSNEVLDNYNKINKLTWKMESLDDVFNSFKAYWSTLPEAAFDVDTLTKLNLRIAQFCNYILEVNGSYKDHGYSLLVTYYLMVCNKYLQFCHII